MGYNVATRCAVRGPLEAIDRFRALMFTRHPDARDRKIFNFGRLTPVPPALARIDWQAKNGFRLMLMALGETPDPENEYETARFGWEVERIGLEMGVTGGTPAELADTYLSKNPEWVERARSIPAAEEETGYWCVEHWYEDHWGTDRPGYGVWIESEAPFVFGMLTAHAFPLPAFEKLADLFPELNFDCVCHHQGNLFAGEGWFNPPPGCAPFALCESTDEFRVRARYQQETVG